MSEELPDIASGKALRAANNLGNRALARAEDGELRGVTPALAKRLGQEIGKPVEFVLYDGAGKTLKDAGNDRWDVGFLAIDPERAKTVSFTRPYKEIVATYAVRDGSPVHLPTSREPMTGQLRAGTRAPDHRSGAASGRGEF